MSKRRVTTITRILAVIRSSKAMWCCVMCTIGILLNMMSSSFLFPTKHDNIGVSIHTSYSPPPVTTAPKVSKKRKKQKEQKDVRTTDTPRAVITASKTPKQQQPPKTGKQKNGKLLFVLHIGPHKTATTAVQCMLVHYQKYLRKASFVYLARYYWNCVDYKKSPPKQKEFIDSRALIQCLNHHHVGPNNNGNSTRHKKEKDKYACDEDKEWKRFELILKYHSTLKTNIILSDEAFSRMEFTPHNMELLSQTLQKYNYHPRIVIGYRRYYEWIISFYNEYATTSVKASQKWPKHQRESFPTVYRKVEKSVIFNRYTHQALSSNIHPTTYLQNLFQSHDAFDNTSIVIFDIHQHNHTEPQIMQNNHSDMDDNRQMKKGKKKAESNRNGNDLATTFFHQVFTHEELQKNKLLRVAIQKMQQQSAAQMNKSVKLDYNMLTVAAHKGGLVEKKLTRQYVHKAIKQRYDKVYRKDESKQQQQYHPNSDDPPTVCISQSEQNEFLNRSLLFERQVLSQNGRNQQLIDDAKTQHQSDFATAAKRGKFCTIDTNKVLKNKEWKKFLNSL